MKLDITKKAKLRDLAAALKGAGIEASVREGFTETPRDEDGNELPPVYYPPIIEVEDEAAAAIAAAVLDAHSPAESDDEERAKRKKDEEEFQEIKKVLKKRLKQIEDRLEALEKKKDKP